MTRQVTRGGNPSRITEAELQQAVVTLGRLLGFKLIYHTHDSRHSAEGFPDLVMVSARHKRVLFVELKSETGQLSEHQTIWFAELLAAEAEVYVWRPKDWRDGTIEHILKGGHIDS